jgi:hypothetical protein
LKLDYQSFSLSRFLQVQEAVNHFPDDVASISESGIARVYHAAVFEKSSRSDGDCSSKEYTAMQRESAPVQREILFIPINNVEVTVRVVRRVRRYTQILKIMVSSGE